MLKSFLSFLIFLIGFSVTAQAKDTIVIAHRGASGYIPEHTIAAKAMAYAMKPDYIEQDVVMTKDDKLVVLHDHYLDRVSDVQEIYPNRKREDGRYYVIDFTLEEIRKLNITERYRIDKEGNKVPVFPDRFPLHKSRFKVHTLEEEIELIQGLNNSTGNDIGIYPEVKSPAFHLKEGKDLSKAVLNVLKEYGYTSKSDKAYVQTFEIEELIRIHDVLLPEIDINPNLVQLMDRDDYYNEIITKEGLEKLSKYADGIGPWIGMITIANEDMTDYEITDLVKNAQSFGMEVHPYTFRKEKFTTPKFAKSYEDLLDIFINKVGVDGVFTDFPDITVQYVEKNK